MATCRAFSCDLLGVHEAGTLRVFQASSGTSVSCPCDGPIRVLAITLTPEPSVACLFQSGVSLFKISSNSVHLDAKIPISEPSVSIAAISGNWYILVASGGIAIVDRVTHKLTTLACRFEKPREFVLCVPDSALVSHGYGMYTAVAGYPSFRLDGNCLLACATIIGDSKNTRSEQDLMLITTTAVKFFSNGKIQHARSFEGEAAAAHIFTQHDKPLRSVVMFSRAVAVLRGLDTVWVFPRDPVAMQAVFVTQAGFLLSVNNINEPSKFALDLSWQHSAGKIEERRARDLEKLRTTASDMGLIGQRSFSPPPALFSTENEAIYSQNSSSSKTSELQIPTARVAFLSSFLLSRGEAEISDEAFDLLNRQIDVLMTKLVI